MSNIPGLLICPVEQRKENLIEFPSFDETVAVLDLHKYGNCRKAGEFEKVEKISEGKFFDIYMCRERKTNVIRALKKFKMPSDLHDGVPRSIIREFSILNTLDHVNIIKSHGPATSSKLEHNYVTLDYCRFSLKDLINEKFPIYEKSVVKCIIRQLFLGLDYIHSALVIHRNISSENIVFNNEGILKITGFEFSRFYNRGPMSPVQSEVRYRAPELLFESKTYDMKVDMWSAGCLLAELVLMKPLITGDSELAVIKSMFVILGTPSEHVWPGFNELFAQWNDGANDIGDSKPYSDLKKYIVGASTPCYNIISSLLLYFSKARLSAKECIKSEYFNVNPPACSARILAAILKNVKETTTTPVTPTE